VWHEMSVESSGRGSGACNFACLLLQDAETGRTNGDWEAPGARVARESRNGQSLG
jgi:hypothetical protein